MKQSTAMTLLVLACAASMPAMAQSTLRPMDASAASLLTGDAPAQSGPNTPPPRTLAPMQSLDPQATVSTNSPATIASAVPAQLAPMSSLDQGTSFSAPLTARSSMLPAGSRLSVALERYVRERGWDLRWQIDEDYVLDANLPIPAADLIESVTWVVHAYQSQGGMYGVVPRFARSNRVVVIEKMDVRDNY
ncbi:MULTISPECIES: toxin co-regulated pilus biosynthesis Q family protein [Stenotrophomonas]|uniref:toxin co-regulated pilus biosynthesis Q family protein n=1 Tax=Stenotrophomonas TaxID=40323 RepID=UPI0021CA7170|nr:MULTISPECIES: toxin co-regulated pilus biosynthesis Q family protein [Stenotrophomonas]MCU1136907.1 TcpQ domain-containing protein [Stenotrophomonas maltophilia]